MCLNFDNGWLKRKWLNQVWSYPGNLSGLKVFFQWFEIQLKILVGTFDQSVPISSKASMSPSFGVSSQLIKLLFLVTIKTLEGTAVMSVLSQMIPASVRLFRVSLADLVKLPFWFLWVKKKRSPSLLLVNWLAGISNIFHLVHIHCQCVFYHVYLPIILLNTFPSNPDDAAEGSLGSWERPPVKRSISLGLS